MTRPRSTNIAALLAVVAALALYPLVVPSNFYVSLATEILIFAVAAMSLDLLLGYTGLASFGHSAYFGLGAYAAALTAIHASDHLLITLGVAIAFSALAACAGGWLAIRAAGIYFIFLTLALAQMVYAVVYKWRWLTGGDDGLRNVPRPSLWPMGGVVEFGHPVAFYALAAAIALGCYFALRRIVSSPFGTVLVGIRENAHRMAAIGYDVHGYKIAAFVIAGAFAGLAGGLFAHYFRLVSPEQVAWQTSAFLMVMVVLGGSGTLIGAAIGAAIVVILQNEVSTYTERWPMIMAGLFLVVVMVARGGVWGLIRALRARMVR